jgi:multimeric flavodoxin WrbA
MKAMKTFKVLGVASSVRSLSSNLKVKQLISSIPDPDDFRNILEKIIFEKLVSNSEACLIAGLYSSKKEGADVDILRLNNYFPKVYPEAMGKAEEDEIVKLVEECDGIIIATPVYFGDRSSYAESFIKFIQERKLFENKVVGVISVGAKRNGGQETTNIYTLWEVLQAGAFVVGNGPKTSQYGGTGWGGDIGSIREDDFGIDTSMGVGKRVAQVAEILKNGGPEPPENFKVSFWITKDRTGS